MASNRDQKIHQAVIEESKKRKEEFELMPSYEPVFKSLKQSNSLQKTSSNYNIGKGKQLKELLELDKNLPRKKLSTMLVKEEDLNINESMKGPNDVFKRWGTIESTFHHILNIQRFGDFNQVTEQEDAALADYIYSQYPLLDENQV